MFNIPAGYFFEFVYNITGGHKLDKFYYCMGVIMKKILLFSLTLGLFCGGLWAADFSLSAGGGGLVGGLFTRYILKADGVSGGNRIKVNAGQDMNQFNYGGLLFFDATYGEFSVSIQNGRNNWKQILDIAGVENNKPSTGDGWETMLGFTLLGKYPFHLRPGFTLFPLLGMEYQVSLVQKRTQADGWIYDRDDGLRETDKNGNAYKLTDWNSLFVDIGCGADLTLTEKIFLRGEFLYSFRLMTPYEIKNLDYMKEMTGDSNPKLGGLTSGPSLRLSAGYRFWSL